MAKSTATSFWADLRAAWEQLDLGTEMTMFDLTGVVFPSEQGNQDVKRKVGAFLSQMVRRGVATIVPDTNPKMYKKLKGLERGWPRKPRKKAEVVDTRNLSMAQVGEAIVQKISSLRGEVRDLKFTNSELQAKLTAANEDYRTAVERCRKLEQECKDLQERAVQNGKVDLEKLVA